MKQIKYVLAYKVIDKIKNNDSVPSDLSYTFFRIRKILQPQWDFQLEEETKIFNKYNPKNTGNGTFKFDNPDDAPKFAEEIENLSNIEVEDSFDKVQFKPDDRINLSIEDLEVLEPFVEYV